MRRISSLAALFLLLIGVHFSLTAHAVEAVTLRVALYPYVPGKYAVFALLAQEFQRRNEGAVLELVEVDPKRIIMKTGCSPLKPMFSRSTPFC